MKNVIFIAPPAAGKGTQSDILVARGYEHISSGRILREEINHKTEIGMKVQKMINNGELVDDQLIFELIAKQISSLNKPFILDGFPRNIHQAVMLNNLFNELNIQDYEVIYLDIDLEEALKRALGRLTCECGASYNIYYEECMPRKKDVCDKCQRQLIKRADDNELTIKNRFKEFLENKDELKKFYEEINKLHIIEVSIGMNKVQDRIKNILK